MNYWLGVASADHAEVGRRGGFAQLGHGKHAAVKALRPGDWIVYYAPRTALEGGTPVQAFVSLGRVTSEAAYQVQLPSGFAPFRVDVDYVDARPAPIRPLLEQLELTRGLGSKWGMAVRVSKARLTAGDMGMIARAMGVDPAIFDSP